MDMSKLADSGIGTPEKAESESRPRVHRGQMVAFTRDELRLIRSTLERIMDRTERGSHSWVAALRALCLLNTGVDSFLRLSDLLTLKVSDVMRNGEVAEIIKVIQRKTRTEVQCVLTPKTRIALNSLIRETTKFSDDYIFTAVTRPHGRFLSDDMARIIVKEWAEDYLGLDGKRYSGHSLRRTKAKIIYEETKDIYKVMALLGHTSIKHTQVYLGITNEDALETARECDV